MAEVSKQEDKPAQAAKPQKQQSKKKAPKKGGAPKFNPNDFQMPAYSDERVAVWDRVKAAQEAERESKPIKITLPDGTVKDGESWKTSPMNIAQGISQGLASTAIVAKVNGVMWDMERPLEEDCSLELIKFDSPEGKHVFWHSSAHILGQALERRYQGQLCIGPPLDDGMGGFYYDMSMPEQETDEVDANGEKVKVKQTINEEDYESIKSLANQVIKEKQKFERLCLSKQDALDMFKYSPYKTYIISTKVPDGETCTAYRCGPLIDLCRGPHVPHTGRVKAFDVVRNSSAYWLGDSNNEALQRVYGISFPDTKSLKEWKALLEEMKKRDHRRIGVDQELFFFDNLSPGSCFMLPHGTRIYNTLVELLRKEYRKRGYTEVISPNIFTKQLFETSGHWQNYKEDMFSFKCEKDEWGLKPMNCPGHCVLFGHRNRSYRELPIRFAEFGVLHRNEYSGALSGLTRVRRFQQDDAHIFCAPDQVESEIQGCFEFMKFVYNTVFDFKFSLELSTRPESKYLGDLADWEKAEAQLASALDKSGLPWKLNAGDGAFYGPKIDIHIEDSMKRSHQCATIQLDFNLPERFKLEYATDSSDGKAERPYIIHRALYGSLERFMAILIEHTGGKWPFWLSPRQLLVVPISPHQNDYAAKVCERFHEAGFFVDSDLTGAKMEKKIARATKLYNYFLVVGKQEETAGSVNIRTPKEPIGEESIEDAIARFNALVANYE